MRNMLLMSVAAVALIAGSGFASAQGPNQSREGSSPAPAAQPSAPAEKMAPVKGAAETKTPASGLKAGQAEQRMAPGVGQMEQKAAPGIKAGQAEQMQPKRANPQQVQDNTKDGMKPKSMGSDTQSQVKPDGKTSLDAKTDGKPTPDVKADTKSAEKVGDAEDVEHRAGRSFRRGDSVNRTAHYDPKRHQAAERAAGGERQLLDLGWQPGVGQRSLLSGADGTRADSAALAGVSVLPGRQPDHRRQPADAPDRSRPRRLMTLDVACVQGRPMAALLFWPWGNRAVQRSRDCESRVTDW